MVGKQCSSEGGNNHYYALTPSATNWTAAKDQAVSWGGNLVTITSLQEQNFINRTFLVGPFEHLPVWIGLVRTATNSVLKGRLRLAMEDLGVINAAGASQFKWVTREHGSYSNWHPNQPDNFPPGENYTAMNWHYSDSPPRGIKGDWNDTTVNGTTRFGGATDGPYFGLVERETDPSQPVTRGFPEPLTQYGLITVLIVLFLIWLARFRRHRTIRNH